MSTNPKVNNPKSSTPIASTPIAGTPASTPRTAATTRWRTSGRLPSRRTLTRTVFGSLAGALLLVATPSTALATEPVGSAASSAAGSLGDAERSIVYVGIDWTGYVEYPTADGGWAWSDPIRLHGSCTGWFASDEGHIVTAGHCVDPAEVDMHILRRFLAEQGLSDVDATTLGWRVEGLEEGSPPDRDDVWVVQPSAVEGSVIEDAMTVQVVDHLPLGDGDLALLKANGLTEATPPLPVATDAPQVGDPVTSIGYPGTVLDLSDPSRLRASFKTGTVSSTQISSTGVANTEVNAQVSAGMSGGPTVDATGSVLGVNSFGHADEPQSFNFITDTAALRGFLSQHDVEVAAAEPAAPGSATPAGNTGLPTPTAAPRDASRDGDLPVSLLAGGGSVLALAAGGAYLLARRRPALVPSSRTVPGADATGFVGRPAWVGPGGAPVARDEACSHLRSAPGSHFCGDCGSRLS